MGLTQQASIADSCPSITQLYNWLNDQLNATGTSAVVTSAKRHEGGSSYHDKGQALDVGGSADAMCQVTTIMNGQAGSLAELIHNDPNCIGSIKDGKPVPYPDFWGPDTWAQHQNHVHIAVPDCANWAPGAGAAPAGGGGANSAGATITNFFNDDPSPVDGSGVGGVGLHSDPQNNRPLLWDRATSPFTKNLVHGSMKTVQAPHYTVYFMFNPQSVDFQYGFTSGIVPIAEQDVSIQNDAQILMNQTISFQLLFDRIYEVGYWEWSKKNGGAAPNLSFPVSDMWGSTGPHTAGVNWDIRAIERLIGIYDSTYTAKPAPPGDFNNPNPAPGQLISSDGVPMGNAVDVALGSMAAPIFRGYVGDLTTTYTRFNEKMVPVRAEVSVTLYRLQIPHPEKIAVPANYNPYVSTPTVY